MNIPRPVAALGAAGALALAGPAALAHASTITHVPWSCAAPYVGETDCGQITVPYQDTLYAGVDVGNSDTINFKAYLLGSDGKKGIQLGSCQATPGTACRLWANFYEDDAKVVITVNDDTYGTPWGSHQEAGGFEVRDQ